MALAVIVVVDVQVYTKEAVEEVAEEAAVAVVEVVVVAAEVSPFLNYSAKKVGVYIQAALVGGWWPPVVVF